MADDKAGWEVEGFIDRLTRRNDSTSERLVLEAISHLRAFSRDCDALRESNRQAAEDNERLRAFAEHMRERYQMYLDHHGTEGTCLHPKSLALLESAMTTAQRGEK